MIYQSRHTGDLGDCGAGVRDPWFRSLEPQVQEILAGTNWTTLKDVYDDVSLEDRKRVIRTQPRVAGGD